MSNHALQQLLSDLSRNIHTRATTLPAAARGATDDVLVALTEATIANAVLLERVGQAIAESRD